MIDESIIFYFLNIQIEKTQKTHVICMPSVNEVSQISRDFEDGAHLSMLVPNTDTTQLDTRH